jgi:hypothetical protein
MLHLTQLVPHRLGAAAPPRRLARGGKPRTGLRLAPVLIEHFQAGHYRIQHSDWNCTGTTRQRLLLRTHSVVSFWGIVGKTCPAGAELRWPFCAQGR